LGTSVTQLAVLVARDFGWLIIIAFAIAAPLAFWALTRWLQAYPYRIDLAWWRFLLAGLTVFIVAILTVGYHVVRIAMTKPSVALNNE
jgi:hypothetical protein